MYLPDQLGATTVTNWTRLVAAALAVFRYIISGSLSAALGSVFRCTHDVLTQLFGWTINAFPAIADFVHTHIYWVHVVAWSTFFGPIVLLVPFLLAHEILILLAYNLTYFLHGLFLESLPDQYEVIRFSLLDTRESLFSFVDRSSSVFNRWTAEHMPLMLLRLTGGALGSILLCAIWVGW